MKGQFQSRPQSKSINRQIRPSSRFVNSELAQESFRKGKDLQKQQSYGKAIEQYLRALMYDPNYFQAYCNMGSCYRSQGKYLESRSMYLKSIAIKSDDTISHYNLANVERIIGNYQNSIKHYEYVIRVAESGQNIGSLYVNSLINLGICFKITEQFDKAIDCYEKAKKIDPNDETIVFNQAMAIMAILQTINTQVFHEVSKQRAMKAETLLNQILKKNPQHQMATLKLCRVSSILDKSNENLNKIVTKLKEMLANKKSTMHDEINSQLGYVLKLLKQYEKSATHYNQSFNKPRASSKLIEANIYDSSDTYLNDKISVFSEEEAIKLVKEGRIDEVKESIARLEQTNISKHVVQLAIYLELSQKQSEEHFKKAVQIYNKYFTQNKVELPFEKVSIEAHKLIGNVLSKQNKFKESIKHFQYISSQLKSNVERSAVHTSLGSDYEAMGDKQKALKQYKLALQQQPQNYQLIYNVGCCLHDAGNHAESNVYFQKFLKLISNDNKIFLPTKNLYVADCLVTMAGSTSNGSPEEYQRYEKAWKAIKQVEQGESQNQVQFDPSKLMNYYLRWADLLEDKMLAAVDKKSDGFMQCKQILLEVYMCLLETPGCPDRDAILNNCAILYYEEKLYVNALANLNQVTIPTPLSLTSLSLTYLHLGEHFMATKSIYAAYEEDPNDPLITFNKDIIQWIYGISKEGPFSKRIDNQDDSKIFSRWQYAILVLDSLSRRLKEEKEDQNVDQKIPSILDKLFQGNNIQLHLDQIEKIKFKHISSQLQTASLLTRAGGSNYDDISNLCITKSQNVEADLKHLVQKLDSKDINQSFISFFLNIFIFMNKQKGHSIRTYIQREFQVKSDNISIDMDRRVTITEDLLLKQYSFSSLNDIVSNLCTWECQLQAKIIVLFHIIQKIYYGLRYRDLLQVQYHFPRHNQLEDCSITANRVISLIISNFHVKTNIKTKESKITSMKNQLIDEIEADFQMQMRKQPLTSISLSQKFKVLTINAFFATRDECIKFIKELQRQSSNKKQIQINKNADEINIFVSGILGIRCSWNEQNTLKNAVRTILESPLELYHQSILQIEENICFIQDSNEKIWEKLSKIEVFKS